MRCPLEAAPDRGDEAGVLVRDDELDAEEPALFERAQERPPEELVFGIANGHTENLSVPVLPHARGDHDGLGDDVVIATDMEVGGVEVHVGEPGVVEGAGAEGLDRLVELGADAAHLAPRDPRSDAQGCDEVVDRPGGHPLHVGLHHDRVEGLVDATPGLEERGEEAPLPELRDLHLEVAGLRGHGLRAVAVALGDARLCAFVAAGADRPGGFCLHELLEDETYQVSDEVDAVTGAERVEQRGHVRLVKGGHRGALLWCVRLGTHRGSPRWPTYVVDPPVTPNPTTWWDSPSRQRAR